MSVREKKSAGGRIWYQGGKGRRRGGEGSNKKRKMDVPPKQHVSEKTSNNMCHTKETYNEDFPFFV